jgi:hypothetical protein
MELSQVVFTGGRNQPGTTKPEEGDRQPYSVLNCEATRESILPYVLFLQKIIRRRPFMIKTLENVMRRLLQSLVCVHPISLYMPTVNLSDLLFSS